MEVSPQAEGGEGVDVQPLGAVGGFGGGQPTDQGAEFILPAFRDGVLHHGAVVAEVVGDLDGAGELHLLVAAVG